MNDPRGRPRRATRRLLRLLPSWVPDWVGDARRLLVSQLAVVISTTVLAIILARSLGPADWGLFSALLGLSMALSIFVNLGLGTWLLRELSDAHTGKVDDSSRAESSRRIVGAVTLNLAFGAALLVASTLAFSIAGAQAATTITILGLIGHTVFGGAAACIEALLRAERRLGTVIAATLIERFSILALAVAALAAGYGIAAIGVAYLLGSLGRLAFVGRQVFWRMRLPVRMPTPGHLRRFVASGLPFAFNTMALTVVPRLDTVILATFSLTAAGYFALGDRVLGPAQIIPVVASTALYPFLAREAPGSTAARRISVGMMALGCGLALAGAVLAPWAVPTIFGSSYRPAIGVVQVMFFALPFVYASNPLIAHLYTTGRERRVLFATLAASAVGTAAIVVGQVTVGVVGAAAGYVFRQALFTAALAITANIRGAVHNKPADSSVLEVAGDHEADA